MNLPQGIRLTELIKERRGAQVGSKIKKKGVNSTGSRSNNLHTTSVNELFDDCSLSCLLISKHDMFSEGQSRLGIGFKST